MKNLRHGIELVLLKFLKALFGSLDEHSALRLGRQLGICAYALLGKRRAVAMRNMELCGIGHTPAGRRKILKRCLENFGMTLAEFARLNQYTDNDLLEKVRIDKFYYIEEAFARGRGALLLSGHYDNWEILVQALAARGLNMSLLVRRQHNLGVDDLINRQRLRKNVQVILAEVNPREILRALEKGKGIATLLDIWGGKDGRLVELFGHQVSTPGGALEIAVHQQTPIMIGLVERLKDGRHFIVIDRAHMPGDFSGSSTAAELLRLYNGKLEDAIRRKPFFWLWTHKRFKDVTDYR